MLRDAVDAAGDYTLADYLPQLRQMQTMLSGPQKPIRTYRQMKEEWINPPSGTTGLFDEVESLEHENEVQAAQQQLRQAVELALHKIRSAGDAQAMLDWARSDKDGWQWALARLAKIDKKKYVAALVFWMNRTDGKWVRQVFAAIDENDPEAARELARLVPASQKSDLTVQAYTVLEKAQAIKDPGQRIDALIQVILDPKSGWEQRGDAIDCLVPPDNPLKFPDRKIDQALLRLLDPKLGDEDINLTVGRACHALALRGRLEYLDQMVAVLPDINDGSIHDEVLASLVQLSQQGGPEQRTRLLDILRPHIRQTNHRLSDLLLFIYVLDLRELKGELERIATAGPDDYEGDKANCSGGSVSPVNERYHMARKIPAIWNEGHPPTRAKLLIAFAYEHGQEFDGLARSRIESQFRQLAPALREADAREVLAFLDWHEANVAKIAADEHGRRTSELGDFVRKSLAK